MYFDCHGPFNFNKDRSAYQWRADFWLDVETEIQGLSHAIGCYVFCLKHGDKSLPWYIGKTTNQIGFRGEIFTEHKISHYDHAMALRKRHKPFFMFFPLVTTERWEFSQNRSSGEKDIDWLETTLIAMGMSANPELLNTSKTSHAQYGYVNGIIGKQYPGRRTNSARLASKIFEVGKF